MYKERASTKEALFYWSLSIYLLKQFGGPDGELGASMRYLSQRYSMPYAELKGLLTDIGIEDLFCAFVKKLKYFIVGFH